MLKNDLETLLQPLVEELGYQLWGFEYLAQGKHSLLRIFIDKETGIGLSDCETVSREVSALLDVEDPITGNYNLEVSSPGIDRPFFYPWQYKQYIGQSVEMKTYKPVEGRRKITGIILEANEDAVKIESEQQVCEILYTNIVKSNLAVWRDER